MCPAYVRRSDPTVSRDVTAVATLRRAWTEERSGGPIDDPGFEAEFAAWSDQEMAQRITWVGEVDGRAVGMLNMAVFTRMPRPKRATEPPGPSCWGYVANMFVLADYRNAGVGTQLLQTAVDHAHANGYARIVLTPTDRAVAFYARLGFAPATALMVRPGD
jgi:GNAT superfamily N-acetyltransferase